LRVFSLDAHKGIWYPTSPHPVPPYDRVFQTGVENSRKWRCEESLHKFATLIPWKKDITLLVAGENNSFKKERIWSLAEEFYKYLPYIGIKTIALCHAIADHTSYTPEGSSNWIL
jgi:hypothetical protein